MSLRILRTGNALCIIGSYVVKKQYAITVQALQARKICATLHTWGHHSALCKAGNRPSRINVLNPPDSLVSNERDQTGGATEYKVVKLDKQGVAASKAKKKLPPSECHSSSPCSTALQSSQQVCNWLKAEKKLSGTPLTLG